MGAGAEAWALRGAARRVPTQPASARCASGSVKRPREERAARDRSLAPELSDAVEVVDRRDATGRDHRQSREEDLAEERRGRARERAVARGARHEQPSDPGRGAVARRVSQPSCPSLASSRRPRPRRPGRRSRRRADRRTGGRRARKVGERAAVPTITRSAPAAIARRSALGAVAAADLERKPSGRRHARRARAWACR